MFVVGQRLYRTTNTFCHVVFVSYLEPWRNAKRFRFFHMLHVKITFQLLIPTDHDTVYHYLWNRASFGAGLQQLLSGVGSLGYVPLLERYLFHGQQVLCLHTEWTMVLAPYHDIFNLCHLCLSLPVLSYGSHSTRHHITGSSLGNLNW